MLSRAIVRPPGRNFAAGLTRAGLGAPNYERALEQHEAYCGALERCGLKLLRLEPDAGYPDSCFVEDTSVLITHSTKHAHENVRARCMQAVLTRPGAPSRTGEVETMRAVLQQILPESALHQIMPPGTLDGGDVCDAGGHYFIGVSERTNEAGARQFAEMVASLGCTSSLIDIRRLGARTPSSAMTARDNSPLLHLKSGLAYLDGNRLVVNQKLAERKEFADFEHVLVTEGEDYAANCVTVNDHVLIAAGYAHLERKLREAGYRTIALEMSEFEKMDGGLSCLSLRW